MKKGIKLAKESDGFNKKYIAFFGDIFYPFEGWEDFMGAFGSLDVAIDALVTKAKTLNCKNKMAGEAFVPRYIWDGVWAHIVDLSKHEIVWRNPPEGESGYE